MNNIFEKINSFSNKIYKIIFTVLGVSGGVYLLFFLITRIPILMYPVVIILIVSVIKLIVRRVKKGLENVGKV